MAILCSDNFNGPDGGFAGRTLNNALGGTETKTWTIAQNPWILTSNVAWSTNYGSMALVNVPTANKLRARIRTAASNNRSALLANGDNQGNGPGVIAYLSTDNDAIVLRQMNSGDFFGPDRNSTAISVSNNTEYYMELERTSSSYTARLYSSDGVTLIGTVAYDFGGDAASFTGEYWGITNYSGDNIAALNAVYYADAGGTAPTITTTELANATVGSAYNQAVTATGDAPIAWSLSAGLLPSGLSLDSDTGVISGTPDSVGTSTFTVLATNGAGSDSQELSIAVGLPTRMTFNMELQRELNSSTSKQEYLETIRDTIGSNYKLVGRDGTTPVVTLLFSGALVITAYQIRIQLPYADMDIQGGVAEDLTWRVESTSGSVWGQFGTPLSLTNNPAVGKGLTISAPITINAPASLPDGGDPPTLTWSGVPSSISMGLGATYNLAQHVTYTGSETISYSSVGTSLSGTGISLNSSTGLLTVSGEASPGTVSGIKIRATAESLVEDSSLFSVVKQSSVLVLDFPASFNLTREYEDGSGKNVVMDFEDYVTYSGGGTLTYTWIGGRPSKYISLNSSTANNGYPGRLRVAANSPPLSFPTLTVQVTDGTHTETATFSLNVSVPGYQTLRFQEFLTTQIASRSGRIILGHHTLYDGSGTLVYSSIGSSLPAGASLNSSTGLITLNNVTVGSYTGLKFRITDGTNTVDTPTFTLNVVNESLIYPNNLVWLGAFRMPSGMENTAYMGRGMGADPTGNSGAGSLFVPSYDQLTWWGEISIPTPTTSTNKNSLARAAQLQAMVDAYEGTIGEISPPSHQNGGILPWGSEVVMSAYQYYGTSQVKTHWIRPRNLSTTGSLVGPVESLGTTPPGWYSNNTGTWPRRSFAGNMARVPSAKQSIFGGPAVSGQAGITNIGSEANGPFAGVFDPDAIGVTTPLPYKGVVGYPLEKALCTELGGLSTTSRSVSWNQASMVRGMAIPAGKDAMLFFGVVSRGEYWYGEPTTDAEANDTNWGYDPMVGHSNKGPHAWPAAYTVWAYRNADIDSVRSGAKKHYEILPYAMWTLELPLYDRNVTDTSVADMSAAFDETTNRLYICCHFLDGDQPIIHVLEIQ